MHICPASPLSAADMKSVPCKMETHSICPMVFHTSTMGIFHWTPFFACGKRPFSRSHYGIYHASIASRGKNLKLSFYLILL